MVQISNNTAPIVPISIEDEMRTSYLDYAMSVIVSRAIPDVTDGLKPVHRRILYAMYESSCHWNKPYRKSARTVGEVMGKYHPHGDKAIYDSMVRMAQDFSLRVPLIDGQGNFGSMDGDEPAAMRYTESRLAKVAHTLLEDLDKDTVDFQENYDGSEKEPVILPARFPNLLVNGAGGIAVGMATNIPPHNLGEIIDACLAFIDNPAVGDETLLAIVPGPDFPTGGIIQGRRGAVHAIKTGRGPITVRGRTHFEEIGKRQAIVITEIPYQVNKALMLEKIGQLVRDKKLEGIAELRDESDKSGVRVVIELKKEAIAEVVLNQLFTYTPLQTNFGVNMLALDNGQPRLMSLRDVLTAFIQFREKTLTRRTRYLLYKARDKAHIYIGLSIAVANIDEVITLIRQAKDPADAKEKLLARPWGAAHVLPLIELVADAHNKVEDGKCYFTEEQAKAILEMRLSRLTGLEQGKINEELQALAIEIKNYLDILHSREKLYQIMRDELTAIKNEFATPRRTMFEDNEYEHDIEDLIQREDMVVTVTLGGYIKRVPLSTYRAQKRGGKGRAGVSMNDEDITTKVFVTDTHTSMLFFSTSGKVFKLKVYKLPLGTPQAKGRALVNVLPLEKDETVNVVLPYPDKKTETDWDHLNIMFATNHGTVRRNHVSDFDYVPSNGKIAMKLEAGDKLVSARVCSDKQHILLSTKQGKSVRFPVTAVRQFKSRASTGVRGIKLAQADEVISMSVLDNNELSDTDTRNAYLKIPVQLRLGLQRLLHKAQHIKSVEEKSSTDAELHKLVETLETSLPKPTVLDWASHEQFILTLTENGYGKRSSAYEYRTTNRGGSGIVNIVTSQRNGNVVASYQIEESDHIILITTRGQLIRCPVIDIRIAGRNTQGVTIFRTEENEKVISAARIKETEETSSSLAIPAPTLSHDVLHEEDGAESAAATEEE